MVGTHRKGEMPSPEPAYGSSVLIPVNNILQPTDETEGESNTYIDEYGSGSSMHECITL